MKVVRLPITPKARPPVKEQPQFEVIELLESYLARAKSGELQGVAIAGALADGHTTEAYELGGGPYGHVLMASITYLHTHYATGQIGLHDADGNTPA